MWTLRLKQGYKVGFGGDLWRNPGSTLDQLVTDFFAPFPAELSSIRPSDVIGCEWDQPPWYREQAGVYRSGDLSIFREGKHRIWHLHRGDAVLDTNETLDECKKAAVDHYPQGQTVDNPPTLLP